MITPENAPRVQARIIAEAANGPVEASAEPILNERGTLIIPDVYLNAGGVTVSYFEWLKNLSHVSFERMHKRYEEMATRDVLAAVEDLTSSRFDESQLAALTRVTIASPTKNISLDGFVWDPDRVNASPRIATRTPSTTAPLTEAFIVASKRRGGSGSTPKPDPRGIYAQGNDRK